MKKKTTRKPVKKNTPKAGSTVLTPAQNTFVLRLLAGDTQRAAYRVAYPNCHAADHVVDAKASRLFALDKVRARYEALMEEAMAAEKARSIAERMAAIVEDLDVLVELSDIATGRKSYPGLDMLGNPVERPPSLTARLKALEMMGKYYKLFTDKQEIDAKVSQVVEVVLTDD